MSDWRTQIPPTRTARPPANALTDILGHHRALAIAEVRDGRGSWGAIMFHHGHGTGTRYYHYNHGWIEVYYDGVPKHTYAKLRAALRENAKLGPVE